jgi:hypothetical protein
MTGKPRDFRNRHNRVITNYLGPGPLLLEELTNHIAGSFLPPVPEHLVQYQEEIRKKKSNVSHFFSILEETFVNAGLSPRLENLLNQSFTASKIEEIKITPVFLENLMEALDILKTRFPKDSQDNVYLDKLITSIFSFYKLLKNR